MNHSQTLEAVRALSDDYQWAVGDVISRLSIDEKADGLYLSLRYQGDDDSASVFLGHRRQDTELMPVALDALMEFFNDVSRREWPHCPADRTKTLALAITEGRGFWECPIHGRHEVGSLSDAED